MSTKGSWHLPHDQKNFNAGHERAFGKRYKVVLKGKVLSVHASIEEAAATAPIGAVVKEVR